MRLAFALLVLLAASGVAARAQQGIALPDDVYKTPGPHVVVNGTLLNAPVKEVGGSLLLPMRAVFEALQADVRWFAAAQQIVATRGATTVQLWIGRPVAIVNNQEVRLAAAPTLMDGATYVPLRFPAEAFGGEVKWLNPIRTAAITITPVQGGAAPVEEPPVQPPVTPPAPQVAEFDGVLVSKITQGVSALLVRNARGETAIIQVAPDARITRAGAGESPAAATFASLEPGDAVRVVRNAAGHASAVVARTAQVKGVAAAIANNKLLLEDGSLYQLQPDIRVVDPAGKPVALAQVGAGSPVTLDLTPDTTNVWRMTVSRAAAPPAEPAEEPRGILTVAAVEYTKPVSGGQTLTIQVTGEPDADRVTARVGDVIRDVTLNEVSAGTYRARVRVPANTNATNVPIHATMRLGGKDLPAVASVQTVTIDTRPPSFDALTPADGAEIVERSLTLEAAYTDAGGSGVDPQSVKLTVGGADVTARARITDTRLTYRARNLPSGVIEVRIEVADLAGNRASADWSMTVSRPGAEAAGTVRHDATAAVTAGRKVNLVGKFEGRPTRLEWFVGKQRVSTAVTRDAATGEYRAAYTVDPDLPPGDHSVSVRAYTSDEDSQVFYAASPLTVVAQPRKFEIVSPKDDAKAPVPLEVTGHAAPGSRVRVTVRYTSTVAFIKMTGSLFKDVVTADDRGAWTTGVVETDVRLVKPDGYTVTAELLGKDGEVTATANISLKR